MDETTYQRLADQAFRAIGDAFEDVDAELVDCEIAGDVVTLTLPGAKRCIINTQRPTRQILARRQRARLALLVGRGSESLGRRQGKGRRPFWDHQAHREGGGRSRRALCVMSPYEAIGGETRVRAVLEALYDRLFVDPMVGFLFEGKDKGRIVEQQVSFTCRFLGGPQTYEGMPLPRAHAGLPLLPGHFDRRHWLLSQVLDECGVPGDVKQAWLQIDDALRPSVLASAGDARARTREGG